MHAGEGGEAPPLTSSKSNKSTSPSCVRMWTVGKCGKRAWELVCVGVRVTGGRQGRGRLAEEMPFACLRTIIALVKLTSQEASMDVVQGFVLTAAAPCTGLCAERRKSLKPFGRGVYAKRVRRVRPMHLRGSRWSPEVVAGETGGAWRSQRGFKNPICDVAPREREIRASRRSEPRERRGLFNPQSPTECSSPCCSRRRRSSAGPTPRRLSSQCCLLSMLPSQCCLQCCLLLQH